MASGMLSRSGKASQARPERGRKWRQGVQIRLRRGISGPSNVTVSDAAPFDTPIPESLRLPSRSRAIVVAPTLHRTSYHRESDRDGPGKSVSIIHSGVFSMYLWAAADSIP